MVHLGKVATDKERKQSIVPALENLKFEGENRDEDTFTASVYGSKFAAADLPKHEMPEHEMPKEVAYRMIKDDLTLDGTPTLK